MSSEFDLIRQLAPFLTADTEPGVAVGHGDDAAVLDLGDKWVCVAVDVVVDGVHFRRDVSSPEDVGWKAVAVNVSDLAAMGATSSAAVVGLCRPADVPAAEIEALYRGMRAACDHWGVRLVGGDTVHAQALALSVTAIGSVVPGQAVTRGGARPGDALVLVGTLGAAAAALLQIGAGEDAAPSLLAAHRRPMALAQAGPALAAHGATAMIDISDGLGADLGHLCAASETGATVDAARLPIADGVIGAAMAHGKDPFDLACGGGEDFALLAAVPADQAEAAAAAASAAEGVTATIIGTITQGPEVAMVEAGGRRRPLAGLGYDHYRTSAADAEDS